MSNKNNEYTEGKRYFKQNGPIPNILTKVEIDYIKIFQFN